MAMEIGLLRQLIANSYTPESLGQIKRVLAEYGTHDAFPVANGLFAAEFEPGGGFGNGLSKCMGPRQRDGGGFAAAAGGIGSSDRVRAGFD
ncbi:MAG: hypothetical protein WAK48_20795, partial [Candidatus Acidiferrum sp.]